MRRILIAAVAASSLILAGCGGSDSGNDGLDAIKVSSAKSPKVTVAKGYTATKTESKVLKAGGGDKLASGDAVKVNYVAVNGRTGKQFDSSFKTEKPLTLTLDKNAVLPGFVAGLEGQTVGSRVLVAISPKDGFGQDQDQLDIKKDDTMVFLFDIVSKVPTEVTGTAKKLPADVPKLVLDDDKHPSKFTKTSKTAKKITKESAHIVIQGDGAEITEGQTLTAQYVGQVYPDGEIFDESWSSSSRSFQVGAGQLIKCWDDQLVGQKLGSRVVLICPGDKAYGDSPPAGSKIGKDDTLIFAIDLLDAS
ncbi:hypothetical protein C6I20_06935 [Aeromicrobium sp. A1-2]|uniref:FKBP-type peptidyl-prolyl cis-trans isomerase n=1 Tax=Aeromicrobium sp. A1-2 TaxID=2107713 RepID=UPI000E4ADE10|nr:FKBP-type peptidyl-prolyl cis-trans isomerase [Aeromicrobium sp. A1-2]AXT84947.1 hypothetical protein C6I20_06935 [Aeromicrobium sp. A1-2]